MSHPRAAFRLGRYDGQNSVGRRRPRPQKEVLVTESEHEGTRACLVAANALCSLLPQSEKLWVRVSPIKLQAGPHVLVGSWQHDCHGMKVINWLTVRADGHRENRPVLTLSFARSHRNISGGQCLGAAKSRDD
jgi:hypothetical protein